MRFSACLSLVCLGLALGCTAKSPPAESEPEIVIPTGALVVLADDATVYFDPAAATGVPVPKPNGGARGYTVEVIAVADGRLEVRTLGPDHPPTCAGNFAFADDYELHFWIDRTALRRILVIPKTFAFADETMLELRPGIPVIDEASGELAIGGQSLFVTLDHARLGLTYERPVDDFDRPKWKLRTDTSLRYGERSLVGAEPPFTHAGEVIELPDSTKNEQLLVFDNACGRFTLRAPANALTSSGLYAMKGPKDAIPRMARTFDPEMAARSAGILGVMRDGHFVASPYGDAFDTQPVECTPPRWTIASGVALTWADGGRPAGTVRRAHQLPADAREVEDRVCFELDGLELCADASKLGREVDPDCPAPE